MIEAICSLCKMIFHLKNDKQGKTATCRVCNNKFTIPNPIVWEDLQYDDVAPEIPKTEISRRYPTCIIFLIDQSSSMNREFRTDGKRKNCVANVINRFLYNIAIRCTKGDGINDYFYVALYGYGGDHKVTDLLEGLRPVSWLAYHTKAIEKRPMQQRDPSGKIVTVDCEYPLWIYPEADGKTPMAAAFQKAYNLLFEWVKDHPLCFPPIVMNITDGSYTDANPSSIVKNIKRLRTKPGKVMVMNCHISGGKEKEADNPENEENGGTDNTILYPTNQRMKTEDGLHRLFYEMSSVLPRSMVTEAISKGIKVEEGSRGFAYNADLVTLIDFLDIGTPVAQPPGILDELAHGKKRQQPPITSDEPPPSKKSAQSPTSDEPPSNKNNE